MIETALRAAGAFTPHDITVASPSKRTREQRLTALGDSSRHGDDESRRGKRSSGSSPKDQFCLAHAARAAGTNPRDCGSSCERCASRGKPVYEFYKGLLDAEIFDKFPQTARKRVQEIIDASTSPASSSAPASAVMADL